MVFRRLRPLRVVCTSGLVQSAKLLCGRATAAAAFLRPTRQFTCPAGPVVNDGCFRTHVIGRLSAQPANRTDVIPSFPASFLPAGPCPVEGDEVAICGFLHSSRSYGELWFGVLRDWSGIVQLVADASSSSAGVFEALKACSHESVIKVVGTISKRPTDMVRVGQCNGAIEVRVRVAEVLSASVRPLPLDLMAPVYLDAKGHGDVADTNALTHRFVYLRTPAPSLFSAAPPAAAVPPLHQVLRTRSRLMQAVRNHLVGMDFVEVETPILFKSTPEGAREFLVPTRKKGLFFALPQSPQQHKQLLMAGGLDRYFQIARCFRDEDGRNDRQPEFTQVDMELSFTSGGEIRGIVEGLLARMLAVIAREVCLPLPLMTYHHAMTRYGSDKPDRRFGLELVDILPQLPRLGPDSGVLQGWTRAPAIVVKGAEGLVTRKVQDEWRSLALPVWPIKVTPDGLTFPKSLRALEGQEASLRALLGDLAPGDLILVCGGQGYAPCQVMGEVRLALAQLFRANDMAVPASNDLRVEPGRPPLDCFWVINFPLFGIQRTPQGGDVRIVAEHHPFTAPLPEDMDRLKRALGALRDTATRETALGELASIKGHAYDLVCNGQEVGGGSIRIHDATLQRQVFLALGSDPGLFGHLLSALEHGCPPHGGIALGFDRLVGILSVDGFGAGLRLRDVIAFPKSTNGRDLLANAPETVSAAQLSEYHLNVVP